MELKNVEIKRIGDIKEFGDNNFKVVKFVIVTKDQYPQTLELQCTQEKAENLIKFNKVGDVVDISYNLRGREWTNKEGVTSVFNTIEAWKVFKADNQPQEPTTTFEPATDLKESNDDILPF